MKKVISLILSLAILLTLAAVPSFAAVSDGAKVSYGAKITVSYTDAAFGWVAIYTGLELRDSYGTEPSVQYAYVEGTGTVVFNDITAESSRKSGEDTTYSDTTKVYYNTASDLTVLPAGEYHVVLFKGTGYDVAQKLVSFTVLEDTAGKVINYDDSAAVYCSFDTFYVNGEQKVDGSASDWIDKNLTDRTVDDADGSITSIGLRGWVGFDQAITSFGYIINDGEAVFGDYAQATEDAVRAAGGEYAQRFNVTVPTDGIQGTATIVAVAKLADGTIVKLNGAKNTTVKVAGPSNPSTSDAAISTVFSTVCVFVIAALVVTVVLKKKEQF